MSRAGAPVTFVFRSDLTQARQEVDEFIAEQSRRRVPLTFSASGSGGGASGGFARDPGAPPSGGRLDSRANIDVGSAENAIRRLRRSWEEVAQFIERPLRVRVDTSQAQAAIAQLGGAGTLAGAAGGGGGLPWGAASPNLSYLMGQGGAAGGGAGGLPVGASSPNWSYLMGQGRAPAATPRPRASQFGGVGTVRGLFGLFALQEVSGAVQAIRDGDSAANLARTPEEAQLARAQGLDRATSGLLGGAAAFLPNLMDASWSPQRMVREATESVTLRQRREETEQSRFATAAQAAYRSGVATGGPSQGQLNRLDVERQAAVTPLNRTITELENKLDERTPTRTKSVGYYGGGYSYTEGGEHVLTGDARTEAQERLLEHRERVKNINAQTEFESKEIRRERGQILNRFSMQAGGASDRAIARQEITDRFSDDLIGQGAALGAFDASAGREDRNRLFGIRAATQEGTLAAQGRTAQAAIAGVLNNAARERIIAVQKGYDSPELRQAINENTVAGIAGVVAPASRAFAAQSRELSGSNEALTAIINRNPLGARLATIRTQRDLALQGTQGELPVFRQIHQMGIMFNAGLQERAARQEEADRRGDTRRSLDAEIRQSRFRQQGSRGRIPALLDAIVSDTAQGAIDLERRGDSDNAERRRTLGVERVREARQGYLQSFSYAEINPNAITGTRRLDDIDKSFSDAERRIRRREDEDSAGASGGGLSSLPGLVRDFMVLVKGLDFVARAN